MHSVLCSGLGSLEYFVIIKCTKFGQLILRKIIKIVATRLGPLTFLCEGAQYDRGPPLLKNAAPSFELKVTPYFQS